MVRPKKPRIIDGIELVDNLYPDPRKRPGYYRYRRADGSDKLFQAETVAEANRIATEANALRDTAIATPARVPGRQQLGFHVPGYIAYQERLNPALTGKKSWDNRVYALHQFAEQFSGTPVGHITWQQISTWWDGLTYNQQKLRHAEFRKLFNWLMPQGLMPKLQYNPFTTADDRPRLIAKQKPPKGRAPLTIAQYWAIYHMAEEMGLHSLQIAMALSLLTTWRREDICNLQWDANLKGRTLQLVIAKSAAQKGHARAARQAWSLDKYPALARTIQRARELSLQNRRCPYIVSQWPKRRVWNQDKQHLAQVTPERLSRMFAEVRDACGITGGQSFHEVRGLSSTLYRIAGYGVDQIQELMAHKNKGTTLGYQDADALPYTPMDFVLPDDVIGGEF
ncbi:tyrosine-type recombinase/integrase [uncultured Microbulbifer sp.]|uniref:tyrosine-type recombinase/integrase n=1 Tax=uncultured Microbulbifer sp. TaxID=348147 RepID=UPI0025F95647|nr:tyrosine-type recombinase/integrase [uncultured Microbulbifer sp.]